MRPPTEARRETLERLARERFDLLVVGGGIVGAGTAAQATQLGLRVALVERHDFAAGASSASSKLIHGGLRYLRLGDFALVREALAEGRALRRVVAPHLVRELDFVLPIYAGGPFGPLSIRAALALYSLLGGNVSGRMAQPAQARELVPALRLDGLRAAGVYPDAQTNDARLCLANARAAADRGAAVANRVEVVALERDGDGIAATVADLAGGTTATVRARTVVNASGASVDAVRRLEDPAAGTSVSLSKGAHLVLDLPAGWEAATILPLDGTRVSFAIPWQELLLLGTTDTPFDPETDTLEVTPAEEEQILAEAGGGLEAAALAREAIRYRFAGLRVLPLTHGSTALARREVVFSRGRLGMLSVAGGKLTTYRRIAHGALARLRSELGLRDVPLRTFPVAGAAEPDDVAAPLVRRDVDPSLALHLARTYGSLAAEVLELAEGRPDALAPLAPGAPDVVAQVLYAYEREWALDAEDVLRRRTTLAFRGHDRTEVRARVQELAGEHAAAR
jgi:glycerol-3-phosphate dehydrogenase